MLFANTAPYVFDLSNFFYVRFVFSTAAPLFIFISGFTTEMNLQKEGANRKKVLKRILQVLFWGVMIDTLIWRIVPFLTFDVLYLIAFSQLLILLLSYKKSILIKWITLLIIATAYFICQYYFTYRYKIPEVELGSQVKFTQFAQDFIPLKRMFFDGWFPILPWAAFAIFGSIVYHYQNFLSKKIYFLIIIGLLVLDVPLFISQQYSFPVRNNYLELWYPPSGIMLFIAIGSVFISTALISTVSNKFQNISFSLLSILGKNSLFIYIYHALIMSIISRLTGLSHFSLMSNIALFLSISLLMILLGLLMEKIKTKKWWINSPPAIKFIFGY